MKLFHSGKPDDRGRALVLVHGAGGNHALWGLVHRALRAKGVPAVSVDLPGHGRSGGRARSSIGEYADDLEEALVEMGADAYAVAGHSMGGAVALVLGGRRGDGPRGIGVVSAGARLPVDPMILKGAVENFDCTVENIARFCFAKGTAEQVWKAAAETMAASGSHVLHADLAACDGFGLSGDALAGIRVPTEVVCGEVDIMTPMALSEELVEKIPGANLTRLPACGHMPLIEDPEGVTTSLARLWAKAFEGQPE